MRTDEVFKSSSNNLAAKDLQGHRVTVEISGYDVKKFDEGQKPVLSFKGKEKTLVLNKTNAFSIELALGTKEMDDWIGERITLRPDKTLFEGKMVACIRVDDKAPAAAPPAPRRPEPEPEPEWKASDDDVPF